MTKIFGFYYGHYYGALHYKWSSDAVKKNVKLDSNGHSKTLTILNHANGVTKHTYVETFSQILLAVCLGLEWR